MEGIREHKNGHRRNKFTPKSMPGDGGAVDQSAQEGPPSFSSSSVPHWVLCGMSGCGGMWGVPEAVQMFWCGQCDATEPVHVPRFLEVWDGRCGTQRGAWQETVCPPTQRVPGATRVSLFKQRQEQAALAEQQAVLEKSARPREKIRILKKPLHPDQRCCPDTGMPPEKHLLP
ncbi:uncharacterized protein LOC112975190 isoform X2 [Apteryx rowi]|uniref:uncharacterized protein LOC112975190 isoform X2 n=1 Tax=Apteryx rowi TaxID=308060 RepID=UPI000E1C7C12|nr:uncharacterized protein LOC112975190 isoform X2 [Apteryx rowi]